MISRTALGERREVLQVDQRHAVDGGEAAVVVHLAVAQASLRDLSWASLNMTAMY